MKNLSFYGMVLLFLILVSCTTDNSVPNDPPVSISGYKVSYKSIPTATGSADNETVINYNLQNGKFFSETTENFVNGVSQGTPVTTQTHFYDGNLLVKIFNTNFNNTIEFFYDTNQRLVGTKTIGYLGAINYYRFIYHPNNIVFFERITLPYNDPMSVIINRKILEFDNNDNIVKAGHDSNLDAVIEEPSIFSYVNDNLNSIANYNGSVQTFNYSNVIDTYFALRLKSFGKKNFNLINSDNLIDNYLVDNLWSKNILSSTLLAENFEVLTNNYYKKRAKATNTSDYNRTETTEFFFN